MGIDKQVSQAVTGQMHGQFGSAREDQTIRRHAATFRRLSQVRGCVLAFVAQPQHAARHGGEKAHPDSEHRRSDLVGRIERAKDETTLGQAFVCPAGRRYRDRLCGVGRNPGIGQTNNLLSVGLLSQPVRRCLGIGKYVIDQTAAQTKALKGDLNWRGTECEDLRAVSCRISDQVDQDVDFLALDELGNLEVIQFSHIDEAIEGPLNAFPHAALVVRSERQADHFEQRAVVPLEETHEHVRNRMFAKIGRQIGQTNTAMLSPGGGKKAAAGHACARRNLLCNAAAATATASAR